jgi:hypothetical protein
VNRDLIYSVNISSGVRRMNAGFGKVGTTKDYGHFNWKEKSIYYAHIAAYVFFIGKIPKRHGKRSEICHT